MDFEAMISTLFVVLAFCIWGIFEHFKKFYLGKDMFQKIGWIVERESNVRAYSDNVNLRREDLLTYFYHEQGKLNIPENLQLDYSNETEKTDANKILSEHRNYIIKSYFSDDLTLSRKKYNLKPLEYYMYSLHWFLNDEIKEHRDYKGKIYHYESTDKPYTHYSLTNYGRAYYKLYLITLLYIENNEKIMRLFEYIKPEHKNHIMEHLETNKVSFVCFGR